MSERFVETIAYGESGRPYLVSGDVLTVSVDRSPRFGDLAVFPTREGFICHRIIGSRASLLLTKGDANAFSDGWRARESVLGVVREKNGEPLPPMWVGWALALRSRAGAALRHALFLSPWGAAAARLKRRWLGERLPIARWLGVKGTRPARQGWGE